MTKTGKIFKQRTCFILTIWINKHPHKFISLWLLVEPYHFFSKVQPYHKYSVFSCYNFFLAASVSRKVIS
jgi:hypothetical protein